MPNTEPYENVRLQAVANIDDTTRIELFTGTDSRPTPTPYMVLARFVRIDHLNQRWDVGPLHPVWAHNNQLSAMRDVLTCYEICLRGVLLNEPVFCEQANALAA